MSAIIRVKRRCDEEPLDAILLNCKRRKTEDNHEEDFVLKFAGTLQNQEDDIFTHLKKPTKVQIEENYKKHLSDLRDKIREQRQNASKDNRFKIVNLHRSVDSTTSTNEAAVTIVDIETTVEQEPEDSKYVYDLYHTNSDDLGEINEQDLVMVYPLSDQLVYGSYRDNGVVASDSDGSEDSNDENNWRNDYPDEEDMNSITEDDLLNAVNQVDINAENDLSSDDGEVGFIYSIDSEAAGFEEDIDDSDVNRYGEQYARFKARNNKEHEEHSYSREYEEDDYDPESYF